MIENTIKLPDGRLLGYAEYGQADGTPIIAMHGTPGARFNSVFSQIGKLQNPSSAPFRILALERSGYGLSDPKPGRTIDDIVEDTIFFADAMGLARFRIFAGSGGAPFAIACCERHSNRVKKTAITAGLGPVYLPKLLEGVNSVELGFLKDAMGDAKSIISFSEKAQSDPIRFIQTYLAESAEQIPTVIPPALIQMITESTKSPYGIIDDYRCFGQSWNVNFEDILTPIQFWHSEADSSVPISHAEYLANIIPNASLRRFENLSHIETVIAAIPEVLAFLAE